MAAVTELRRETKADRTLLYWKLSLAYNGRNGVSVTFGQATKIVRRILASEPPASKLRAVVIAMHSEMIEGNTASAAEQSNAKQPNN